MEKTAADIYMEGAAHALRNMEVEGEIKIASFKHLQKIARRITVGGPFTALESLGQGVKKFDPRNVISDYKLMRKLDPAYTQRGRGWTKAEALDEALMSNPESAASLVAGTGLVLGSGVEGIQALRGEDSLLSSRGSDRREAEAALAAQQEAEAVAALEAQQNDSIASYLGL